MKPPHTYNPKPAFILWLLFAIFILYGTLIPFDLSFVPENLKANLRETNLTPFFDHGSFVSRMDIISNLLLFMAYGALFYLAFAKRLSMRFWIFPICVISSFILSASVEFLQFFSPSRTSSVTDVIVNTIGGAIGCMAGWISYSFYKERLESRLEVILREKPLLLVLLIYSMAMFLNFLVPFNISIQVSDVWHSIKNANLVPFSNYHNLRHYFIGAGAELTLYLILGFLINLCLISYTRISRIATSIYAIILTGVFAIFVETVQIFFISRVTDATDVITAIFGAVLGIFACILLRRKKLLIGLYIVFILYYAFSPFAFTSSPDNLSIKNFIPFHAYWEHTTIWTFTDLIEGIVLYLFLGFLLSLKPAKTKRSLLPYFLFGLTLGILIEFSQLFIIGRHFDITDALIAGIATSFGSLSPLGRGQGEGK